MRIIRTYWDLHHAIEMASTEGDVLRILCVVRGYHVYKAIRDPYLGDEFTTKHQKNNPHELLTLTGPPYRRALVFRPPEWSLHRLLPRLPWLKCGSGTHLMSQA